MTQLKKNRIDEIQTLISAGLGSSRIAELKSEDWGISERQVFKYIRDAKDEAEEIEKEDSSDEIVEIFDRFQEGNKFEVWLEAQQIFENNPGLLYDRPQQIDRKAWGEFVKYGWGREERVRQILEGPDDATLIDPLDEYCESVRSGEIEVCKWVRLAVDRHYKNLEQQHDEYFPYYFEPAAAKHFVWFFKEELPHYEGLFAGKPIEFEPWQWFGYGSLFGWYKKERFHDYPIRRFRTGTFIYPKKNGKALAIDTDIPTPNGFRKIEDIQAGDQVFDRKGNPCNVIAATDVMYDRPCYKVEFSDGNTIIADANHEWSTSAHIFRENKCRKETHKESIRTTKEIYDTVLVERCKKESYNYIHRNHRINKNPCVKYSEKDLPIDPYVFGLWLGDGSSNSASITIGKQDLQTAERIKKAGYEVTKRLSPNEGSELFGIGRNKPNGVCNRGHSREEYWNPNGAGEGQGKCRACDNLVSRARYNGNPIPETKYPTTHKVLSNLNVINNKHIPKQYLTSSKDQRLELLRGLMDSDGYCSKSGQCEFTSTNERLGSDTLELIRSLGIKASIGEHDAKLNGRCVSKKYRIHFYSYDDVPVFKLKRKKERQKKKPTKKTRNSYRQIVNVEKVDSVPVKCIQVDSSDNMYLCGRGFIETHNSIISGGAGLYMADYDYWPGAQCFILAKNQSHAKDLGYRAATKMVKESERLDEKYRINRSAADAGIYFDGNNSFYKPITSKAESEDGRNVHFCGPDETKDWTDFDIYHLMEEGMVSAPNSLMMNTTTAGFDTESLGYEQQQYAEDVLSGKVSDETLLALIYTIDEEDKEKEDWWMDKSLYQKANPNFGISVFWETIQAKFSKAQASLDKRQSLITKHLNRWTSSNSAFVAEEKWDACADGEIEQFMQRWEDVLEDYRGKVATGGLDLGGNSDFTSFELVFDGDVQDVLSFFWIPEDTIESRKNSGTVKGFVDEGHVFATKGDWTDHDFVEECIKKIAEIVDLQEVVYDRYKMNQMVTHLENEGIEMTPFGQGYVSMAPAVDHLEDRILKGLINHFGNPVLGWMNGNVSIKKDPAGNRKFDKDKSQDKIDGMVALAMALYRSSVGEDEQMDWGEVKFI